MRALERCLDKLHKHIVDNNLFSSGSKLLLAVSGGPDSVALLCLFAKLRSRLPVTLLCCHVNHGLRGAQSDGDEALTKELCLRLNVPLIARKIKLAEGADLENRARAARFEALFHLLDLYRFDYVVLGHQREDQAETVLMNMLRGAGINGLAGIKAKQGKVLHPLLGFSRQELMDLLTEEGIAWREDATNSDPSFKRNKVRLELLPHLKQQYSADVIDKLNRQSRILTDADEYFRLRAQALYKKLSLESEPGGVSFSVKALEKLARIEVYYLLKLAYTSVCGVPKDFFYHSFEDLQNLMKGNGSARIDLQNGVIACREYDSLILVNELDGAPGLEELSVDEDRARVVFGAFRFTFRHLRLLPREPGLDKFSVVLDADRLSWPLNIRTRKDGDRFVPQGMDHSKKLKNFFIDAKVPRRARDLVPIIEDKDKILWVVGHRTDARALADEHSNKLLQIVAEPTVEKPKRAASRVKAQGGKNEQDELRYFGSPF